MNHNKLNEYSKKETGGKGERGKKEQIEIEDGEKER